ncbi:hypothetical protein C2G38_2226340 [Gigaspora rosea]|uniref:Uncharacterized protein n=1 Tax=Gigaspora rosea TaxID=44941 RepID=A0A397TYF8_9GLOM|nr:hypothetical protein C2G38_2226340 [Gigaspora rosea]
MAEQQFKLTQENKALVRRITILKQSTLELQNENQKLKRKLKDTQEHVNLKDLSEDETDEMKQITKEIPNLVTIVETNTFAATILSKKILVTAASGKESPYMNPEIPEERKYIEELTQEYIYLCEELSSKERYKVEGKDIYNRSEISEIKIVSKTLYIAKRLLKRIKVLYEAIQEEITRIAVQYYLKNNENSPYITVSKKRFLRRITKDYIDLQDSNQENNIVEQILSKEELDIKLQRLLDQIKIQIQTLQGQLTLEEAYKNHEYMFLFKRTTVIYKLINSNKPEVIIQRKYLSQIRKLVEFYIKDNNLHWSKSKILP